MLTNKEVYAKGADGTVPGASARPHDGFRPRAFGAAHRSEELCQASTNRQHLKDAR